MSADNGIYIGRFPTADGGMEYRVIHAQAIENVDYGTEEEQDLYRVLYFGSDSTHPPSVFTSRDEAYDYAHLIAEGYDILEYGVSELTFSRPLIPLSVEAANVRMRELMGH